MVENRFKKSVENATKNTEDKIKDDIKNEIEYNRENNIKESTRDNIEYTRKDSIKDNRKPIINKTGKNILEKVLEENKKDKGSNHTIYLSAEVSEELDKLIKKTKNSKSMLIDKILREVLFDK